jgi:DnaJ-class molecular chaperone
MIKHMTKCPKCDGHKGIPCRCVHGPGMDVCDRCNGTGEVLLESLTEAERNPPKPIRYERDDI